MRLKKKVGKWLAEGIITSEQAEAILNREKPHSLRSQKIGSPYIFLAIASFSIFLGALSLIAANWAVIPASLKLFNYFLLIIAVSVLALKLKSKSEVYFSALLIFFMLLCLAGIGLIAQIYNLEGDSWQALFLWCTISSGCMLISQSKIASHLWLGAFSLSLYLWSIQESINYVTGLTVCCGIYVLFFLLYLFLQKKNIFLNQMSALKPWTLIIGFYILILSILSFDWFLPEKSGYSASFFSIYLFCILLFLSIMTVAPLMLYRLSGLIYLWLTGLLFILFSWVTFLKDVFSIEIFDLLSYFLFCYFLLFMLLSISFRIPKITFPEFIKHKHHIFENWTVALGFLNLINFNILNNSNPDNSVNPMNTLTYSFFIFLIFPILYANIYTLYYNNYKKIQKFLLSGLLILGFLFFIAVWNTPESNNLINLFFSLLILLGSSFLALSFKSESLFKLAIIAFILRLYFFYIEIFQNLIQTGISLILIGLVIIILFIVHQKYKEKLEQWMRQLE